MESGRTANPIEDLRKALEKETRKRQALEHQLSEALTLLQNTMKDREKFRNLVEDTSAVIFDAILNREPEPASDSNPALPADKIEVLGPPPTSGTRDAFAELALGGGAKQFADLKALRKMKSNQADEIKQMMTDMRNNPVHEIHGEPVKYLFDYESSICKDLITGEEHQIELPKSNVLIYETVEGTRMAARPSGTEPKIKFYFSVNGPMPSIEEAADAESKLDQKIRDIIAEFKL